MLTLLSKFLMNKYTLAITIILSTVLYIKSLSFQLEKAEQSAQTYEAIAKDQSKQIHDQMIAFAKEKEALEALAKEKQKVIVKVEERVVKVKQLEKVYVKDTNGCSLSDDAFRVLTDSYNQAQGSVSTK